MKRYYGIFQNRRDVEAAFELPLPPSVKILFACYETPSYDGYAIVLFEQDGKLWEVDAAHCSCMGLEGQWGPEEACLPELLKREFYDMDTATRDALRAIVRGRLQ